MPAANTECMNLHLQEISTQVTPGSLAVLICDGAGWHQTGGELKLPDNIILLPLPPYSPELNPMENVWEYLRANKLSARVWDDYDAILQACAEAWNCLINDPDRIRSIGTRDGQRSMSERVGIRGNFLAFSALFRDKTREPFGPFGPLKWPGIGRTFEAGEIAHGKRSLEISPRSDPRAAS